MGLQAFDFCATALFVFAIFSYLPYLKTWLLSLVSLLQKYYDKYGKNKSFTTINTDKLCWLSFMFKC